MWAFLVEQIGVDELGKERTAFVTIADDHIHHLIITGVAEGLGVGTVNERGAKQVRMKLALAEGAVGRLQIRLNLGADRLKALEHMAQRRGDRSAQVFRDLAFQLYAVRVW